MSNAAGHPRRDFWNSAYAKKVVCRVLGADWEPVSGLEVWELLPQEIRSFNTRGQLQPFDAVSVRQGGVRFQVLFDGMPLPERDDGVATYPEFRRRLFALAHLLKTFRRVLRRRIGKVRGLSTESIVARLADRESGSFSRSLGPLVQCVPLRR